MDYEEIRKEYNKNDMIKSIKDGVVRKYSGYLTLCGEGYDSFNKDLVVYQDGKLADVVKKGVDHEEIAWNKHVDDIRRQCKQRNCTPFDLLR